MQQNKIFLNIAMLACSTLLGACEFQRTEFWYKDIGNEAFVQVDRIGLPYWYEVFFDDEDQKINQTVAKTDIADDNGELADLIEAFVEEFRLDLDNAPGVPGLRDNALTPKEVAEALTPNVLQIDLSLKISGEAFNGHNLQNDDSFDALVSKVSGRSISDGVSEASDAGDMEFPFLKRQNY